MKAQKIQRAILFINHRKEHAKTLADEIINTLDSINIKSDIFSSRGKIDSTGKNNYDVAISLGGDGTVLSTARAMSPKKTPIFPVNLGTFGFIAGVQVSQWREVFDLYLGGKASLSRRLMLEVSCERKGTTIKLGNCLNEVVISSPGVARLINLRVCYCDKRNGETLELGHYRADGLIISTPTGSTAYSAAAGGPIVDPELEAIILNSICPFTLTHRPLLLPIEETLKIEVDGKEQKGVLLTIDGQVTEKLKGGDKIYIKKAPYPCLLIASGRKGFFQALRTKLAWTGSNA